MPRFEMRKDGETVVVDVPLRGRDLLCHPVYNKGTAFTDAERHALGLSGLLPRYSSTLEQQQKRAYADIMRADDELERYVRLAALQDRNETLYYRVLLEHLEEMLPIVYTPTVGRACERFSHIFRRGRGLWLTPGDAANIDEMLGNAPFEDVRLIVVTDNERILGLGDQGAGGMGIPIGKLALYCAAAGIHPSQTLPVSLDVGTDNQALLDDDLYIGVREKRLRGEAYDSFVDEFVQAVKKRFPRALLQWEDFKKGNAFTLLDRYRSDILSFNDDIQGTAAIALAGVLAAGRATGTAIENQRIVILGAGAAGIGIARQLRDAMQRGGLSGDDVHRHVAVLDSRGLLIEGDLRGDAYKSEFAWPPEMAKAAGLDPDGDRGLSAAVRTLKPTVLIGTSGQPGVFDEALVREMASHVERPAIFPFSNPTSKSEAIAADLVRWTDGRALIASGSPFAPVEHEGRTIRIGQGNNVYIFPGVGLGAIAAGATEVPDALFTVAAETLAARVSDEDLAAGALFPPLGQLRELTREIAVAVTREAARAGVAPASAEGEAESLVDAHVWTPGYPRYQPA
jgi:malic enzyme